MVHGRERDPGSVTGLRDITSPRTEPGSDWLVIRALNPVHNAITYGCSFEMSTKRVVSLVKKKVSVKSQELHSM